MLVTRLNALDRDQSPAINPAGRHGSRQVVESDSFTGLRAAAAGLVEIFEGTAASRGHGTGSQGMAALTVLRMAAMSTKVTATLSPTFQSELPWAMLLILFVNWPALPSVD